MVSVGKSPDELLDLESIDEIVPPGSRLLVAVSGGADSVAMLLALHAIAQARSISLIVAHVNHGLRPEADGEEAFVRDLSYEMDIGCYGVKLKPDKKPSNVSPEQFWRQSRYAYFEKTMVATGSHFLALGHTKDDLAETFLFHLARGTGVDGLCFSFFKQSGGLPIIRPLWMTSRNRIEFALINAGRKWMSDASNLEVRYSRNLIRHQIMPALKVINPSVVDAIARLSGNLQNSMASTQARRSANADGFISSPKRLTAANGELITELGSIAMDDTELSSDVRDYVYAAAQTLLDSSQTAQAMKIIKNQGTGLVAMTGRKTLVITQKHGWIYPGHQPSETMLANYHGCLFEDLTADIDQSLLNIISSPAPVTALNLARWTIHWEGEESLILRNRRPGDRVGSKLLKKLFIDYKIPWYIRNYAVIATKPDGEIVAVAGLSQSLNAWITRHRNSSFRMTITKSETAA